MKRRSDSLTRCEAKLRSLRETMRQCRASIAALDREIKRNALTVRGDKPTVSTGTETGD